MRRLLSALLVALFVLLPAAALAADPLVPDRPKGAPGYGSTPPLYDHPQFEPWGYTFDGLRMTDAAYASTYASMNALMVAKAWLLKMTLRLVEYTLSLNFFEPFFAQADSTLLAMGQALWSRDGAPLVAGALSLAGLWAILLYLRGRTVRMWANLGATMLILVLAGVLFTTGAVSTQSAVEASRDLSLWVYRTVDSASGTATEPPLVVRSGEAAWQSLVYQPWLTGEFGQGEGPTRFAATNVPGGLFLSKKPAERRLIYYFPNEIGSCSIPSGFQVRNCAWWDEDYLPRRVFVAGWTFLATLLYAGSASALAGGVIVAQLSLLFFLALSPIWLLVLLWWPGASATLLQRLLTRVVGALVSQVVLAASLGLLLYLTLAVGKGGAFQSGGWMLHSVLLAVLGALAFRYRYAWLVPLAALAERRTERTDPGLLDRLRGLLPGRTRASVVVTGPPPSPAVVTQERVVEPLPTFAAAPPPTTYVQAVIPEVERAAVEVVQVSRETVQSSQRDVFHQQMRVLRDQLTLRQDMLQQEHVDRERGVSWEEPPPSQPGRPVSRAARAAREQRTGSSVESHRQRPQG